MSSNPVAQRSILAWFAANPVAANLLMIIIFMCGTLSLMTMNREAYPRFAPGSIAITAAFPGASPREVEKAICIPIEEKIHDLSGIKRLSTSSTHSLCSISVLVDQGYDIKALVSAIRSRTQSIPNLPKTVEKIEIDEEGWEYPCISVVVYGQTDKLSLRSLAEEVREELAKLSGVRKVELWNTIAYEISVEIPAERLRQHHLNLTEVAAAISKNSFDLPGGLLKAPTGELQLRTFGRAEDKKRLEEIVLAAWPDGSQLRLGDIATIKDGFADLSFENYTNNLPAETIAVKAKHNLVDVATRVREFVETLAPQLPEGISITTRRDNARSFAELLDTLVYEGITGFLLVFIVLIFFLRSEVALWAAVGVLISIFGALWWMPTVGLSLNMLSLFGFVLAMGVLVDDAIIVSERIHVLQEAGASGLHGAIQGVQEVATPVFLAVLIALVAFSPGLFITPSWATAFIKPVALVMILTLIFSLVEALLILPAHLAKKPIPLTAPGYMDRVRDYLNGQIERFVNQVYQPVLKQALTWHYLILAVFVAVFILVGALIKGDFIKVSLEEDIGYDNFHVHLLPPAGTPYAETQTRVKQFIEGLKKAEAELNALQPPNQPSVVEGVDVFLEEIDPTVWVEFSSEARKQYHIKDLIDRWYKHIGDVGDFEPDFHTPTEQDVIDLQVDIAAPDPTILDTATDAIKDKITTYPGIVEVDDSRRPGTPELRLQLTPEAKRLGLVLDDLANQVHAAYQGEEAQRFIRGRNEIKVMVRYPRVERESLADLKAMPIKLPNGNSAPLGSLAEMSYEPGYGALTRENRMGVVALHARLEDGAKLTGEQIYADLEKAFIPSLIANFPGLEISAGESKEEADAVLESIKQSTLVALAIIYALIAIAFRSYLQPFIFMLSVPVAWVGAILVHGLFGLTVSFESVVGLVAASGVVVNDSLVLLDYIEARRDQTIPLHQLITEACISRFRPIFLVSLTNLAGFFPMLFETSEQAKFLVPLTLSLCGGLVFGMFATLILVPACYAILADLPFAKRQSSPEIVREQLNIPSSL